MVVPMALAATIVRTEVPRASVCIVGGLTLLFRGQRPRVASGKTSGEYDSLPSPGCQVNYNSENADSAPTIVGVISQPPTPAQQHQPSRRFQSGAAALVIKPQRKESQDARKGLAPDRGTGLSERTSTLVDPSSTPVFSDQRPCSMACSN